MKARVRGARAMVAAMDPALAEGEFVFTAVPDGAEPGPLLRAALASIREDEGLSVVIERGLAAQFGLDAALPMRRIVLRVHSALDGVGLTAAVATALAGLSIPCNVVAGYRHDHVFVPAQMAGAAMEALRALQRAAVEDGG